MDKEIMSKAVWNEAIGALIEKITNFLYAEVLSDPSTKRFQIDSHFNEYAATNTERCIDRSVNIYTRNGLFGKRELIFQTWLRGYSRDDFKHVWIDDGRSNLPSSHNDSTIVSYCNIGQIDEQWPQIMQRIREEAILYVESFLNVVQQAKSEAERKRLTHENVSKVKAHKAAQQDIKTELVKITETSLNTFEALPKHLLEAESLLDQAELDFKEGAFAPFWNSIEQATTYLGSFDSSINSLIHSISRYGELSTHCEGNSPHLPIVIASVKGMIAGNTTADRMKAIVRQAQRNFQFASIYEQRKTNQILISGFTNLAQALDGMGYRIATSINELSGEISAMSSVMQESFETLGDQIQTGNQQVVESLNAIHTTSKQSASDVSERHDRALEMLDNIQRRRMPTGFYAGIGTKPAP